jgi:hypothetical protein
MQVSMDDVVNAIRWRLNLAVDGNTAQSQSIWERLRNSQEPANKEQLERVSRFLSDVIEQAVRCRLQLPGRVAEEDRPLLESLWQAIEAWIKQDPVRRSPRVSGWIKAALGSAKQNLGSGKTAPQATPRPGSMAAPTQRMPPQARPSAANPLTPPPAPAAPPPLPKEPPPAAEAPPAGTNDMTLPSEPARPLPTGPQWLYKPPPPSEPDPHDEWHVAGLETPEGGMVLGARVRGKKHKHDGTHCDDWFGVAMTGPWTVMAVADGAGSRKLSRVGARASCERAIEVLIKDLAKVHVPDRPSAGYLLAKDDTRLLYTDREVAIVQQALYRAVWEAYASVEEAARQRQNSPDHQRLVGRAVTPDDLSATLLLAAHTTLKVEGQPQSLVLACQVGDGAIAAVDLQAGVHLLGHAESGDYSGETDFLTSRRQREETNLQKKTFALLGPIRALMVMTDGVADDYFPPDPGLARLYADLVLNGILPCDETSGGGGAELGFDPADRLDTDAEAATPSGPLRLRLRSTSLFASEMGVKPEEIAANPALLRAGARGAALASLPQAASPQDRLRTWLDVYTVRGSFDDRTLVVLNGGRTS